LYDVRLETGSHAGLAGRVHGPNRIDHEMPLAPPPVAAPDAAGDIDLVMNMTGEIGIALSDCAVTAASKRLAEATAVFKDVSGLEFLDLCGRIGCAPRISANIGSGTVQEMNPWIEYITCDDDSAMANLRRRHGRQQAWKLRYVSIGNESWGCGGFMRPEYYVDDEVNGQAVPSISVSASRAEAGGVHVSLCNLHPERPATGTCDRRGQVTKQIRGQVLTADRLQAHNTFANPD
jgi:alpha-L-arabinofuranosidase